MHKKFELIKNDSIEIGNHKLYRIRALINFNDVKAGDLGGYVESENNLSQMDDCWIYDNACVYGNACVFYDACVYDNARVFGNACVFDDAKVFGNACVYDDAKVFGNACVYDNARVSDSAYVADNAKVFYDACVFGSAHISGDAIIEQDSDYIVFKNNWSSGRYFTYTRSNKMWKVGCFYGTGDELIQKAYADSEDNGKHYELCVNLVKEMEK